MNDRIRSVYEGVIAEGLRRDSLSGATDEEIDRFAAEQGVKEVPAAVREVLRLIGDQPGRWFAGTTFGVHSINSGTKRHAVAILSDLEHEIRDPAGMLVLTAHQGYVYQLIDGADLGQDDPPVWEVEEGAGVNGRWFRVSNWFEGTRPSVAGYLAHMEARKLLGLRVPPLPPDIELR